jgi:hypothetical protein
VDGQDNPHICGSHSEDHMVSYHRVNPKDYLDNKAKDKEIVEEVKAQFGTNRGTLRTNHQGYQ